MITIICGGSGYILAPEDYGQLHTLWDRLPITKVITGECLTGADQCAKDWALGNGINYKGYPAAWTSYGRSAGFLRNTVMAGVAQACIAFPGGNGTADMVAKARAANLLLIDLRRLK